MINSYDLDGSLVVNGVDLATLNAAIPGPNLCMDFDKDGLVLAGDAALLQLHMGHACDRVVPTHSSSWGAVKVIYR